MTRPATPHQNRLIGVKVAPDGRSTTSMPPNTQDDHRIERDQRQHAGGDDALVEGAHDVVVGAELDEVGADDRGDDAGAADGQRQTPCRRA